MRVTHHALKRHMERVMKFDFTPLQVEYMCWSGNPSLRAITDGDLMRWIEKRIDLKPFRQKMVEFVSAHLTEKERNKAENNKYKILKRIDDYVYVINDGLIITVMPTNRIEDV